MLMGCGGGSNVRSPNPSETNTTTFCKPPSAAATTSSEVNPPGCNLAQLGSAFMFMRVGAGREPSNLATPFTTAVPGAAPSVAEGRPRAGSRPATNRTTVVARSTVRAFAFIDELLSLTSLLRKAIGYPSFDTRLVPVLGVPRIQGRP